MSKFMPSLVFALLVFGAACGPSALPPPTVTVDATHGPVEGVVSGSDAADAGDAGPVPVTADDPVWGSRDALVTIVEFGDLQCPFSRKAATTLAALREKYGPSDLRIVWKNTPLAFHALARIASEAATTAFQKHGNAAFWAFYDAVYLNERPFSEELYRDAMIAGGVTANDVAAARMRVSPKIDADIELGRKNGVTGTPGFLINGVLLSGAQPLEKFSQIIDAELSEARAVVARGTPRNRLYAERTTKNRAAAPPVAPPAEPAAAHDTKTVWRVPVGTSPVRGKPTALVTIVEFADYQCPFCGKVEATLADLRKTYGDKIRLVFKDEPLPFHPHAEPAAEVALEVRVRRGDAAFWTLHDALYADQTHLEEADLVAAAARVGVDRAPVLAAIQGKKHHAEIDDTADLADDVGAQGTPTFYLNGRKLVGAQPADKFREIIDEEIAKADDLVKHGTPAAKIYDTLQKTATSGAETLPTVKLPAPTAANPSRGPANARIVVQYFSDFQCPFCKRVEPTIVDLEKAFPGQVRIVWRNLPLPFHKDAELAAEAAMEAYKQKGSAGFWAMHEVLFADQTALGRAGLDRAAVKIGLDPARFAAALDAHTHKAEIAADEKIAADANITGTPGFVINGYYVSGAQPIGKFKKVVHLSLAPPAKVAGP